MRNEQTDHQISCHCGKVKIRLHLPDGIGQVRRCDCSICRRKGWPVFSVLLDDLQITQGADVLALYQFDTMTAKHYFCRECGIHTHHQRRSTPTEYSINSGCLEHWQDYDLSEVTVLDGINHPKDP